MAGEQSLLDDVQFHGGGGSYLPPEARRRSIRPASRPRRRSASTRDGWARSIRACGSRNGGGGTFTNIWSPNTCAQSGFYVSDTKTPGHVYETVGRASPVQRDQARSRRELGLQRAADRRRSVDEPGSGVVRDQRVEEHHHRQLPRLPRHAQPRAGPGGGARQQLLRHPLPQRARQGRERLRHLRRQRLRHLPARQQVPLRERDPGRDASPRSARAGIRGASTFRRRLRRQRRPRRRPWPTARSRSWRAASTRSPARRWMPTARSTSSITISSGSSRGRRATA